MWLVDDIVEEVWALARPKSRIDLSPKESLKLAIGIATHAKKAKEEEIANA
nr:MAG TPA: hypothetical protein [Caudoviricetes sp.]